MIGMAQPGLVSYEPAYADELAVIMQWAFEHMQRDGSDNEEEGGSVYLRLSTRAIDQLSRTLSPERKREIVSGGYWLVEPSSSTRVILAYQGAVSPEAIGAAGLMAEDRHGVGVLALTSADRLYTEWRRAQSHRHEGRLSAPSRVEQLLSQVPRDAAIVTVIDGYPATLAWLGGVLGHRVESLGVDRFGQTGTVADLYRNFGFDAEGIMRVVESVAPGRPIRFRAG
jgi:pyruvate dehydrogenase E1 component